MFEMMSMSNASDLRLERVLQPLPDGFPINFTSLYDGSWHGAPRHISVGVSGNGDIRAFDMEGNPIFLAKSSNEAKRFQRHNPDKLCVTFRKVKP